MVLVSYSGKEINAKLVYYGPGLSGKTTNLEYIYGSIPGDHRGKMVSMKTKTERTLFFDFLPVQLGELSGFKTRFLLYTVPGQVYYNATRKLVLKGVDAVVFVADSKRGKMDENIESLQNLRDNLKEHALNLDDIPWVIQYNKRDLPEVYTLDELEQVLNPKKVPAFEAVATNGSGVVDTFKAVSRLLLKKLAKEVGVPAGGKAAASGPASGIDPTATQPSAKAPEAPTLGLVGSAETGASAPSASPPPRAPPNPGRSTGPHPRSTPVPRLGPPLRPEGSPIPPGGRFLARAGPVPRRVTCRRETPSPCLISRIPNRARSRSRLDLRSRPPQSPCGRQGRRVHPSNPPRIRSPLSRWDSGYGAGSNARRTSRVATWSRRCKRARCETHGPKLRSRPRAWPRHRSPAPTPDRHRSPSPGNGLGSRVGPRRSRCPRSKHPWKARSRAGSSGQARPRRRGARRPIRRNRPPLRIRTSRRRP